MTDPATKDDVKVLVEKLDKLGDSVKGMREQNSIEHGSIFTKLTHAIYIVNWVRDSWRRFGILSPPPAEPADPPTPPKDDTQ